MPTIKRIGSRLVNVPEVVKPKVAPDVALGRDKRVAWSELTKFMHRSPKDPFERHLLPDVEGKAVVHAEISPALRDMFAKLPRPDLTDRMAPQWYSVAIFFNLRSGRPGDYVNTTVQDALNWLDEGADPCHPGISEFMYRYWRTVSYGHLAFGMNTPRDASRRPIVLEVDPPAGGAQAWEQLVEKCVDAGAEAIWQAAGSLTRDGKRWIPSIVLVQHYSVHASAWFGGFERSVGGHVYLVGDYTHITYGLDRWSPPDAPAKVGRGFWGTLCHEFSHNFLEFYDLYGPQGCTGYWDILGDNTPPGRMSEVCAAIKFRAGWLAYKQVISGPHVAAAELALKPYTTTGEAYKVVPDPVNTPHEYFLLEYRKATGQEVWRPDGALPEEGLLVLHINERMGLPSRLWLLRDAPYFDPEFADASDHASTRWTGHDDLRGKLFPQPAAGGGGVRNAFTRASVPSSDLYGKRPSGLSITNIRVVGGELRFTLQIDGNPRVGWTVGAGDRALAGRFTAESVTEGEEVFLRNADNAALLTHVQAQWNVVAVQNDWIGQWNLGTDNRELVGDLDGDGRDEIYIRSPEWAGVLKWDRGAFQTVSIQNDWIDGWNLGGDNWEHIGDFDGDGRAEVYIRSPGWAGVLKLVSGQLRLQSIQQEWIDQWHLGQDNTELVGRFSQRNADEIMIRSPEWIGLLRWDNGARRLALASIQNDWVDGWNMGGVDWHCVGDFDGDGLDEVFIRSPQWAGLLKWSGDRFHLLWIRQTNLEHDGGAAEHHWPLQAGDRIQSGRFRPDRDGLLLWRAGRTAVAFWKDGAMKIHHNFINSIDGWNIGAGDKLVLGDFHPRGRDIGDPNVDFITDALTDVFIHNGWGTGMLGVNYIVGSDPAKPFDEAGLTWSQAGKLLYR
ncbi:MAG: hypothetical protein IPO88_08645 [Nannocystis sp.]|uniref:hypothetical protein n=1 Tax=Nannocystis sp. TaxID=1962667 RepID=UPI002429ADCE|nr:hypothetical protein [Nannocystis sp.]MBK9753560.1 hypothetical protein [Nannocystis sp.]